MGLSQRVNAVNGKTSVATAGVITLNTIEPGAIHVFKIWWLLLWRGVLLGGLAGAAVGFILGIVFGVAGVPPERAQIFFVVSGYLVGIGIFAWVISMMFDKLFSDFRIVLISLDESVNKEPQESPTSAL